MYPFAAESRSVEAKRAKPRQKSSRIELIHAELVATHPDALHWLRHVGGQISFLRRREGISVRHSIGLVCGTAGLMYLDAWCSTHGMISVFHNTNIGVPPAQLYDGNALRSGKLYTIVCGWSSAIPSHIGVL